MGRRTYRKGSRSRTRRGHKNFETYKGSKRYSEKRFKRKFGRKTGRAPFFPFAGGMSDSTKVADKIDAVDDLIGGSRMRHSYRRRRPHFRTYRHKKRSRYNRRRSHRNRKQKRSKKQKKSRGLFSFLFS